MPDEVNEWLAAHDVEPSAEIRSDPRQAGSTVIRLPTADGHLYLKQNDRCRSSRSP
jgi:hypothetical protein